MKEKKGFTQQAYEFIKEKIIKCEMMPEQDISEDMLMKETGFSRTPIREALLRLDQERLINIYPRKGIFVSSISVSMIEDIFQVREVIEPYILRQVAAKLPKIWLEEIKERFLIKPDNEDILWHHVNLDKEFHSFLIESFRNVYFTQLMGNIFDQNQRLRILSFRLTDRFVNSSNEHIEIIDALLKHDIDCADASMREHIANARNVAYSIRLR